MITRRDCEWCGGPIPLRARKDSVCCSVRCRQARHRFARQVGRGVASGHPLRLAYADPPYPGKSALYYREHPNYAGEVDHDELIARLRGYDGWALSTSARALPQVLASCPPGVRVAVWVRGARVNVRAHGPLNAYEPVIFSGGRAVASAGGRDASPVTGATRRVDVLVAGVAARLTDPSRVTGAKPPAFATWVFELLGAAQDDTLDDLYPGSGGIARAWQIFTGRAARSVTDLSREVLDDASSPIRATTPRPPADEASLRAAARRRAELGQRIPGQTDLLAELADGHDASSSTAVDA